MPHPAHFICSHMCRFVLATEVGGYIVSTVGEYWPEESSRRIHAQVFAPKWYAKNKDLVGDEFDYAYMKKFGYQELGPGRSYETMVFRSKKLQERCCPYQIAGPEERDFEGYTDAASATAGHMRLCKKWARKNKD